MTDLLLRDCRTPEEYPVLVRVWRSSVDATHDFLTAADRDAIESRLASDYFPQVRLTVAEVDGAVAGFAGTAGDDLAMLFVHADARGRGVGRTLLDHAVRDLGVRTVDVNEQNAQAVGFYAHSGFVVAGRSATDDEGRPYPLLHLALTRD
ncbi:acetyltransferase [Tsukamurella tyrosinosolvens]|uniref:acetyltransferase n=1 Tax=Tsukamurella tyrosinosolvens TaxID=57704 RepID=UPI000791C404|nr:acetyltransferase [Tsukamurella tyrosinosolvens]KXP08876.1 GCN5 family acetyltransferase [Tsukamurella tyrosinosolvens]KZL97104.1 GCN5 family acetyltransferase [Tsukamurella tyrosinosolvens]WEL94247.1 acetyltransferase [Tsukamurella tyrosinosolvens]